MATPSDLITCLRAWLSQRVPGDALAWLDQQVERLPAADSRALVIAFGMTARKLGRADLQPTAAERDAADALRPGWRIDEWTIDQVGRAILVLHWPSADADTYQAGLERLLQAGDTAELLALYRCLPLLPWPERWAARAGEGLRSNITAAFRAVATNNPYPAEQLSTGAWNQMVLKALFVGVPLAPIVGLDLRANQELAQMLRDYAHERWAASRSFNPELWRCVGPFATDDASLADLQRALGEPEQQAAAALALHACPDPRAAALLATNPTLHAACRDGQLTWAAIATMTAA